MSFLTLAERWKHYVLRRTAGQRTKSAQEDGRRFTDRVGTAIAQLAFCEITLA